MICFPKQIGHKIFERTLLFFDFPSFNPSPITCFILEYFSFSPYNLKAQKTSLSA